MTDRRSFIGASAALAATAAARPTLAAVAGRPRLYKAVVDARFPESLAFAREAARAGLPLARIKGDVTDIWFNDLGPRWKTEPAAVVGMTGADALFCLERLGWDAGLRVVFRAEHAAGADGAVEHRLSLAAVDRGALAGLQGEDWPQQAARLAMACRFAPARQAFAVPGACAAPAGPAQLVTWVIAPVQRA